MKKCFFILNTFLLLNILLNKNYLYADKFLQKENFSIKKINITSKNTINLNNDKKNNKYSSSISTKIYFPKANISLIQKTPSTKFTEQFTLSPFQIGTTFYLNNIKNIPLTIKVGNLSYSGSYSKINNPLISSVNTSLSKSNPQIQKLIASNPTISSSYKDFSIFTEYNYKNKNSFIKQFSIQTSYNQNNTAFINSYFCINNSYKNSFYFSTASLFYPDKNDFNFFQNFQINFLIKNFNLLFVSNLYTTNFNQFSSIFLIQNRININNFFIKTQFFYNPQKEYIYTQTKTIKTVYQLKITPQLLFYVNNSLVHLGNELYIEEKYSKINKTTLLSKANSSLQITTQRSVNTFNFNISEINLENKNILDSAIYKISLKNKIKNNYLPIFNNSFQIENINNSKKLKTTYNFSNNFMLNQKLKIDSKIEVINQNNKLNKISPEAKIKYLQNNKNINYSFSLAINMNIKF